MPNTVDFWNIFQANMLGFVDAGWKAISTWLRVFGLDPKCDLWRDYILHPLAKTFMKPLLTQSDAVTKIFGSVPQILAKAVSNYQIQYQDMFSVLSAVMSVLTAVLFLMQHSI